MGGIGAPEGTILELFFGTLCQAYRSSIHCQELRQQASWVSCARSHEQIGIRRSSSADTIRKRPAD